MAYSLAVDFAVRMDVWADVRNLVPILEAGGNGVNGRVVFRGRGGCGGGGVGRHGGQELVGEWGEERDDEEERDEPI